MIIYRRQWVVKFSLGCLAVLTGLEACAAQGDLEIRSADQAVTLRTGAQFAGAVSSVVRDGVEYVDTRDHGRLLQSAVNFDRFGECDNPTEAGSRDDRGSSSSRLLAARSGPDWLETRADMAFWLAPGTDYGRACGRRPEVRSALNRSVRDGYLLDKRVAFVPGMEGLLEYDAAYTVPRAHESAVFEVIAAYMPRDFAARWRLDLARGALAQAGQGTGSDPVIRATRDGRHAMGVWSPHLPQSGRGYGLVDYPDVVKWNCVVRETPVPAGVYRYRCYVAVGTLDDVRAALLAAAARFPRGGH